MSNGHDPLDLRGQEKQHADKAMRDKLARENEESDLKWLLSSKRGRRIVWRLLDQAGVFRISFNQNAMQMAFNEGCRNSGNRLLAMVQSVVPESLVLMIKESKQDDDAKQSVQ